MNSGDKWNNWIIDELLGEGQFGKVYRLVRTDFGRRYEAALKVIRIPQNEAEFRSIKSENPNREAVAKYYRSVIEQIIDECSVMYEFKGSGHIVSYEGHSVEKIEDGFGWEICIQMELLTPLVTYLANHPVTEHEVVKIGIDICKALEICQKHNIIHRDIKPENIFVSKQGEFKLGDFGIARCMENATTVMSRKGTVTYMAPEIFESRPYNSTVDIYSLGLLMYRLLNHNRMPFLPAYPQQITFMDKDRALQLRMKSAYLPIPDEASENLAAIILKACALDPGKRYATASAMRAALEAIIEEKYDQVSADRQYDKTEQKPSLVVYNETVCDECSEDLTLPLFPQYGGQDVSQKNYSLQTPYHCENRAEETYDVTTEPDEEKTLTDPVLFSASGNVKGSNLKSDTSNIVSQKEINKEQGEPNKRFIVISIAVLLIVVAIVIAILSIPDQEDLAYKTAQEVTTSLIEGNLEEMPILTDGCRYNCSKVAGMTDWTSCTNVKFLSQRNTLSDYKKSGYRVVRGIVSFKTGDIVIAIKMFYIDLNDINCTPIIKGISVCPLDIITEYKEDWYNLKLTSLYNEYRFGFSIDEREKFKKSIQKNSTSCGETELDNMSILIW